MLTTAGEELDLGGLKVDQHSISSYLGAVGDESSIYLELNAAPPMALAAHILSTLIDVLSLPPGTIHAAQEIECRRLVGFGQEVSCSATLSKPMRRGEWSIIAARFTAVSQDGEILLEGKTTVMVPTPEAPVA